MYHVSWGRFRDGGNKSSFSFADDDEDGDEDDEVDFGCEVLAVVMRMVEFEVEEGLVVALEKADWPSTAVCDRQQHDVYNIFDWMICNGLGQG